MSLRRAGLLLSLWSVLAYVPGLLNLTDSNGVAIALLFGGYIAQAVPLIVLSRNDTHIAAIHVQILAYLVPFVPIFLNHYLHAAGYVVSAVLVLATAAYMGWGPLRVHRLADRGLPATATVENVVRPWFNLVVNAVYLVRKIDATIRRDDGTPEYRVRIRILVMIGNVPEPGATFRVRVDPKNPRLVVPESVLEEELGKKDDPAPHDAVSTELARLTALYEQGELDKAQFAVARSKVFRQQRRSGAQPPAAPLPADEASSSDGAAGLARLEDLHTRGLIDDEKYASARKTFEADEPQ